MKAFVVEDVCRYLCHLNQVECMDSKHAQSQLLLLLLLRLVILSNRGRFLS